MEKNVLSPPALRQFLEEEVRNADYAALLLERAETASMGKDAPGASGNAYYVAFHPNHVVIEHHYAVDWPPLRLDPERFRAALIAWRNRLTDGKGQ
ncbi:MAG: hypothetical protein VB101_02430 [Rhodospirillaceae bacterium]|nr:hypothetical protein [Rhodospirillaceae bacterium]